MPSSTTSGFIWSVDVWVTQDGRQWVRDVAWPLLGEERRLFITKLGTSISALFCSGGFSRKPVALLTPEVL